MAGKGISREIIFQKAYSYSIESGVDSLDVKSLASSLGIRAPSLYKHVSSLDEIKENVSILALKKLAEEIRTAAASLKGEKAFAEVCHAYRRYALNHPGHYRSLIKSHLYRSEEYKAAGDDVMKLITELIFPAAFSPQTGIDHLRMIRSALHGFTDLEISGGFGYSEKSYKSFAFLIKNLYKILH